MTVKIAFGRILEKIRIKRNLTQEQLALEASLARRFLQDMEAGEKQPTITSLFKLCRALNVKPSELVDAAWKEWLKSQKD